MIREGAYFCDEQQTNILRKTIFNADASFNTAVVGKSALLSHPIAVFQFHPVQRFW